MTVVQPDTPDFLQLVDADAALTQIGSGYVFTEGPAWSVAEQSLYFSDIPGDKRFRWNESAGMELIMEPTFKGNGMAFDIEGRLIVCEARHEFGHPLPRRRLSRNRVLPSQGRLPQQPQRPRRQQPRWQQSTSPIPTTAGGTIGSAASASHCLDSRPCSGCPHEGGEAQLVVDSRRVREPNGLCFSPDESIDVHQRLTAGRGEGVDVADDGMLINGRVLMTGMGGGTIGEGSVDGMECDEFGNVWVTGPGGVWVLSPDGERLGIIRTPEVCGSLCWVGPICARCFLTTSTTVHTMRCCAPPPRYLSTTWGDRNS